MKNIKIYQSFKFLQSNSFHLKTLVHSHFSRFKTLFECIFWYLFELRRRRHFDGIDIRKMGSLWNRFDLRKEKKVKWGQIGEYEGVPKLKCFFLRETTGLCEQERLLRGSVLVWASQRLFPKSKVKVMLIVFFDIQGIVHFQFLPHDQTMNQTVYKEILWCLVRSVRDKRRSLWEAHTWTLYHDNAPAHKILSIR